MTDFLNKLQPQGEEDYVLPDDWDSVWIEVGPIPVYIRRHDKGVIVELCKTGSEAEDALDTCQADNP